VGFVFDSLLVISICFKDTPESWTVLQDLRHVFTQQRKNWVRRLIAMATCLLVITALLGLEEGFGKECD